MDIYSKRRKLSSGVKNTLKVIDAPPVDHFTLRGVEPNQKRELIMQSSKKVKTGEKSHSHHKEGSGWLELIQVRMASFRDLLMIKFFDELK